MSSSITLDKIEITKAARPTIHQPVGYSGEITFNIKGVRLACKYTYSFNNVLDVQDAIKNALNFLMADLDKIAKDAKEFAPPAAA